MAAWVEACQAAVPEAQVVSPLEVYRVVVWHQEALAVHREVLEEAHPEVRAPCQAEEWAEGCLVAGREVPVVQHLVVVCRVGQEVVCREEAQEKIWSLPSIMQA